MGVAIGYLRSTLEEVNVQTSCSALARSLPPAANQPTQQPTIGWLAVRTGFVNGCRRLRAKRATKKSQTMYLLNRNDTNGDQGFIWQMQVLTEN